MAAVREFIEHSECCTKLRKIGSLQECKVGVISSCGSCRYQAPTTPTNFSGTSASPSILHPHGAQHELCRARLVLLAPRGPTRHQGARPRHPHHPRRHQEDGLPHVALTEVMLSPFLAGNPRNPDTIGSLSPQKFYSSCGQKVSSRRPAKFGHFNP